MADFSSIIRSNVPTLVDFYADWCGPCQRFHQTLDQVKQHFKDSLTVIKINVDKNAKASNAFKIRSVPTLICFQSGEILWRIKGTLTKQELINKITQSMK